MELVIRKDDIQIQMVLLMFCTERYIEKEKKTKKKTGIENDRVTDRLTLKLCHLNMRFDAIISSDYWTILPLF